MEYPHRELSTVIFVHTTAQHYLVVSKPRVAQNDSGATVQGIEVEQLTAYSDIHKGAESICTEYFVYYSLTYLIFISDS